MSPAQNSSQPTPDAVPRSAGPEPARLDDERRAATFEYGSVDVEELIGRLRATYRYIDMVEQLLRAGYSSVFATDFLRQLPIRPGAQPDAYDDLLYRVEGFRRSLRSHPPKRKAPDSSAPPMVTECAAGNKPRITIELPEKAVLRDLGETTRAYIEPLFRADDTTLFSLLLLLTAAPNAKQLAGVMIQQYPALFGTAPPEGLSDALAAFSDYLQKNVVWMLRRIPASNDTTTGSEQVKQADMVGNSPPGDGETQAADSVQAGSVEGEAAELPVPPAGSNASRRRALYVWALAQLPAPLFQGFLRLLMIGGDLNNKVSRITSAIQTQDWSSFNEDGSTEETRTSARKASPSAKEKSTAPTPARKRSQGVLRSLGRLPHPILRHVVYFLLQDVPATVITTFILCHDDLGEFPRLSHHTIRQYLECLTEVIWEEKCPLPSRNRLLTRIAKRVRESLQVAQRTLVVRATLDSTEGGEARLPEVPAVESVKNIKKYLEELFLCERTSLLEELMRAREGGDPDPYLTSREVSVLDTAAKQDRGDRATAKRPISPSSPADELGGDLGRPRRGGARNAYRGELPPYAERANRKRVIQITCKKDCCTATWAELDRNYPGREALKKATDVTATCLRCGKTARDNYNWWR